MSAGVSDQRMKGQANQVSNGSKEQLGAGEGATGSEEFEPWRSQQQQQQQQQQQAQNSAPHTAAYGAAGPISNATDLYSMSTAGYYGSGGTYPYQAYGVGDGTWSNGTDPMTFLSGYPHDSYSMDGMFGPSTAFSTPTAAFAGQPSSFNYFPSNGDYNTWGAAAAGSQLTASAAASQQHRKYDEYYREQTQHNVYAQPQPHTQDTTLKGVEHAMQNLDLKSGNDGKESLGGGGGGQQKKTTWASIASQPAKPQLTVQNQGLKKKGPGMPPGPIVPGKHNMDIGTWDTNKSTPPQIPPMIPSPAPAPVAVRPGWQATVPPPQPQTVPVVTRQPPTAAPPPPRPMAPAYQPTHHQGMMGPPPPHMQPPQPQQVGMPTAGHIQGMMPAPVPILLASPPVNAAAVAATAVVAAAAGPIHPVLDELRGKNNYNPPEFDLSAPNARFFVIKSYSEDDIHRSIKYEIWCSTEHGNKRLDQAFREQESLGRVVYLFFSVNGSGHFCGMAQMVSSVDYHSNSSVWSQDKWKGQFKVRWIYVKDVPNVQLRHIRLENNDSKPVTNSRDTQEVPHARGLQVLRIMHTFRHSTSIFDDFVHYEKRQEEEDNRKLPVSNKENNHHPQQPQQQQHHQHHQQQHQQQQQQQQQQQHHHHHESGEQRGGGGRDHRDHHRDHRGGGGGRGHHHDRDNNMDNRGGDSNNHHRSGGHRGGDRGDHHGGGHHRDRGDSNRPRGNRGGRN